MRSRKKVSTVPTTPWRASLHNLIFEAETKAGKTFDIILMILIALSVATVMLEVLQLFAGTMVSCFIILSGSSRLSLRLNMSYVSLLRFVLGAMH